HRIGILTVRVIRFVGNSRALSWRRWPRRRRCGGYRADTIELCAGRSHGGFHRTNTDEIDGMTEDTTTPEAEDLREETAADAPEVAEHDAASGLQAELEDMRKQLLYAQAETQNVRRRMEKDAQDARAYAATSFARDILSV